MSLPVVPTSNSKGQIGLGTILSIGPAASAAGTPVFIPIGYVESATPSGGSRNEVKWSELNNRFMQKRTGVEDAGDLAVKVVRVANDPGQVALKAAWQDPSGQAYLFQFQTYPNTADGQTTVGDSGVITGPISKYKEFGDLSAESLIMTEFTIALTSEAVVTPGS